MVKKGFIPWNKGTKGICKSNSGSFKKGHIPWTKGKHTISPMQGKHHTKETIEKIRTNLKRRHCSPYSEFKKNRLGIRGDKSHFWKGGKYINEGYVLVYKPEHPFAYRRSHILEHRLVMEKHLGRYLKSTEIVHHKNGVRTDNRLENLILTVKNKNWHPCFCPKCGFEFLVK